MPATNDHPRLSFAIRLCAAVALATFVTGCANYNFRIIRPQDLQKIISDSPAHIQTANMSYQMQAREGRLVVQVYNEKDQAVQLLGDKSFVVDTAGASHPLRSTAIAPHSYTKLILPPLRPRVQDSPQWNFGVSGGMGDARPANSSDNTESLLALGGGSGESATKPLYLDYYEDIDAYYWDWDGERPIRLSITYQLADGQHATDEFTIEKVKR